MMKLTKQEGNYEGWGGAVDTQISLLTVFAFRSSFYRPLPAATPTGYSSVL